MKITKELAESNATPQVDADSRAKLGGRESYLLEAQRIRDEIGDLPQILQALGINQRRACQLLLVDPSAWTRWNKTGAPPHIYQALRWLLELKKSNHAVTGPIDMAARLDRVQQTTQAKLKELEQGLAMVERALAYTPAVSSPGDGEAGRALQTALIEERRENLERISALEREILGLKAQTAVAKPVRLKMKKPAAKAKLKTKLKTKAKQIPSKRNSKAKTAVRTKPKPKLKTTARKRPKTKKPSLKKRRPVQRARRRIQLKRGKAKRN